MLAFLLYICTAFITTTSV